MAEFTWTPKREQFCREYIIDFNGAQAAIRAGYATKNAARQACELRHIPQVEQRIAELMAQRSERTQVDADYVLRQLVEIDQMDVLDVLDDEGALKPLSEWPPVWRRYISALDVSGLYEGRGDKRVTVGTLKKIKWPDKVKNLELIGKHVRVQVFKERLEHSGSISHEEALEQLE